MSSYEVHLFTNGEYKAIHPTNGEPYRFKTEQAANWHLIRGYMPSPTPNTEGHRKVVVVELPANIDLN